MIERDQLLCFSLGVAMRRISRMYTEALAEHDVTPPQLYLLTCLGQADGQKPCNLGKQVCLDSSSITGLLDRAEKAGLVVRRPDPRDRRSLRIHLTDLGRQRLATLEPVVQTLQARIHREFFTGYSDEDVRLFLGMLQHVQEGLS